MNKNTFRFCAAGCCAAYTLCYLFLPLLGVRLAGVGLSAVQLISWDFLYILPLPVGIAMGICACMLPGKTAGAICLGGSFLPVLMYFILSSQLTSLGGMAGAGLNAGAIGSAAASLLFTIGAGAILAVLFGIAAGIFCFLSENIRKPAERTAGFSASEDDDW